MSIEFGSKVLVCDNLALKEHGMRGEVVLNDTQYTHYTPDADNDRRCWVYEAWYCEECRHHHRKSFTEVAVMPWILATLSLEKLKEIPGKGCPRVVSYRSTLTGGTHAAENTETEGKQNDHEDVGELGKQNAYSRIRRTLLRIWKRD